MAVSRNPFGPTNSDQETTYLDTWKREALTHPENSVDTVPSACFNQWSWHKLMHKSLIRPVVSCGRETWVLNRKSADMLDVFERKALRRILGPVNDDGRRRMRS
ncbi:hypothetical protein AAG570_004748 [Ranatra chinensis]|uniref:Uncharacterized protein n=1 Tax=Ranatra chinensis TaxID=642074 RepID=A0ABD0Y1S2_9HEMI